MSDFMRHFPVYAAATMSVLLVLAAARWCFGPHAELPRFRVRWLRLRLRLRLYPGRGHATAFELWLRWGRLASLRRSARSRPSLSIWQRAARPDEHSVMPGRAHYGHGLRVPVDEHLLIQGPPRGGKTGLLARIILRYPGPVVSTTTKHDVFQLTSGVRARRGPVHVFNPQRIGGVASTFRWNPVAGCDDPATAIRRADGFAHAVSMSGTDDGSFWTAKASDYLRCLFCAAAHAGGDMRLVARWALSSAEPAEEILDSAGADQWAAELAELRGEAQKTAATIRMVLSRALGFMTDPALASSVLPADGERGVDIGAFLAESGTLYLIAESQHDDSPVAPLVAAMAGEIHHVAAQIGQASPSQRLDPPLLMALDEIVQTCPIALPAWLADSGGKGIQLIPVTHGEAQLRTRWGKDGAQVVLDTCGVKIWLPGITDTSTLKMASELCGQAAFTERTSLRDARGERGERRRVWHDVMTADKIRQLPAGHALVIRGGYAPVVARLGAAWRDPAYKAARRAGTAVAPLTPAAVPAAPAVRAAPGIAAPPRRLRAVPDLDAEAAGREDSPRAFPWS
ncbi:MAG: type IV secretory system conjugative DNA transfer family protein [Streptosporangiaceae bacterium]